MIGPRHGMVIAFLAGILVGAIAVVAVLYWGLSGFQFRRKVPWKTDFRRDHE